MIMVTQTFSDAKMFRPLATGKLMENGGKQLFSFGLNCLLSCRILWTL